MGVAFESTVEWWRTVGGFQLQDMQIEVWYILKQELSRLGEADICPEDKLTVVIKRLSKQETRNKMANTVFWYGKASVGWHSHWTIPINFFIIRIYSYYKNNKKQVKKQLIGTIDNSV